MAASDEAGTSVNQVHAWITAGERYDVEFKGEHRGPLNDRELVEAVVCLSNGSGGVLLVGVEDDGTRQARGHATRAVGPMSCGCKRSSPITLSHPWPPV